MFLCDPEPSVWAADADDIEVAGNETQRTYAGRDCRRKLRRACLALKVNDMVNGECPDARSTPAAPSPRTTLQE